MSSSNLKPAIQRIDSKNNLLWRGRIKGLVDYFSYSFSTKLQTWISTRCPKNTRGLKPFSKQASQPLREVSVGLSERYQRYRFRTVENLDAKTTDALGPKIEHKYYSSREVVLPPLS